MLETSAILIHPWVGSTRAVTNLAGQSLGFIRFDAEPGSTWFSWLRKMRLDVYETEDASHLASVGRSWGVLRAWDVYDADDRHVGIVYPKTIVTGDRQRLGFLDFPSQEQGRVLDANSVVLAAYVRTPTAVELRFETWPFAANPFLRMMILASVLVLEPTP